MTDSEDLKAKFREALDKKKERHHASTAAGDHTDGSDKSHGSDRKMEQPEFRRKAT